MSKTIIIWLTALLGWTSVTGQDMNFYLAKYSLNGINPLIVVTLNQFDNSNYISSSYSSLKKDLDVVRSNVVFLFKDIRKKDAAFFLLNTLGIDTSGRIIIVDSGFSKLVSPADLCGLSVFNGGKIAGYSSLGSASKMLSVNTRTAAYKIIRTDSVLLDERDAPLSISCPFIVSGNRLVVLDNLNNRFHVHDRLTGKRILTYKPPYDYRKLLSKYVLNGNAKALDTAVWAKDTVMATNNMKELEYYFFNKSADSYYVSVGLLTVKFTRPDTYQVSHSCFLAKTDSSFGGTQFYYVPWEYTYSGKKYLISFNEEFMCTGNEFYFNCITEPEPKKYLQVVGKFHLDEPNGVLKMDEIISNAGDHAASGNSFRFFKTDKKAYSFYPVKYPKIVCLDCPDSSEVDYGGCFASADTSDRKRNFITWAVSETLTPDKAFLTEENGRRYLTVISPENTIRFREGLDITNKTRLNYFVDRSHFYVIAHEDEDCKLSTYEYMQMKE